MGSALLDRAPARALALALAAAIALGACGDAGAGSEVGSDTAGTTGEDTDATAGTDTDTGEPACAFAGDGVCDEPTNCPLGSNEDDCVAACASGEDIHLFAAACAHRDPPAPPVDDGEPSGGSDHRTGHLDLVIESPSGRQADPFPRHVRLYVPPSYDPSRSTPLVIMMPGHRVSHLTTADYTQLARTADHNRFIVAHAEQEWRSAGEQRWAWWTDWNWSGAAEANPDFAFVGRLLNEMAARYNLDLRRIYLVGHSRGASMAFSAALNFPEYIAAACVQSGFTEFGYLDAVLATWEGRRVPMFFMHGIQDPDVQVGNADAMVQRLLDLGWELGEDVVYERLDQVKHRWQPWLNQQAWDYLYAHPLPE